MYSDTWIATFLRIPEEQTAREIEFLRGQLPLPAFRTVLDLCCGSGRHAVGLALAGHDVTGVDSSVASLAIAQTRLARLPASEPDGSAPGSVRLIRGDMRALPFTGPFDAALIMWQSFGSFDDSTNRAVVADLRRVLRPGGRLILDIYHRGFFEDHQGERSSERSGRGIHETKWLEGSRLHVRLRYSDSDDRDAFDWRVYAPVEIVEELRPLGFEAVCCCCQFDASLPADRRTGRMQLVFTAGPAA